MFKVRNGVTSAVPSVYKTRGLISDIALHPPAAARSGKVLDSKTPANEYS
jgi:hypothetical protein